jgi:hypothetical protein
MARIGKPPVKPIVSKHCLDRLVIDLMDFRGMPDRDFKWILQMKDHFSRFIWVYALKDKASETVGKILRSWFKQNGYPTKWYVGTALYTTIPVRLKDSSASSLSFEPLSIYFGRELGLQWLLKVEPKCHPPHPRFLYTTYLLISLQCRMQL